MTEYERGRADERADVLAHFNEIAERNERDGHAMKSRGLLSSAKSYRYVIEHISKGVHVTDRPDPTAYRDRPPTVEEVRAHAEAHDIAEWGDGGDAAGLWMYQYGNGSVHLLVLAAGGETIYWAHTYAVHCDPNPWHEVDQDSDGWADNEDQDGPWRPCSTDGTPVPWPECGQEVKS